MNEKRRSKHIVLKYPKLKPKKKLSEPIGNATDSSDESYGNHGQNFLASSTKFLNEMRKSGVFTDIDLMCVGSNRVFPAHSVVLASSSGLFRNFFTMNLQDIESLSEIKSSKSLIIKEPLPTRRKIILDIQPQSLTNLLDFMYTGTMTLPLHANQVKSLVMAAQKLRISKFVTHTIDTLRKRLSIKTHSLVWDVASDLDHRELLDEVVRFMAKEFEQLTESGDIFILPYNRLKAVCKYMEKTAEAHDLVLCAILLWVKQDPKLREKDFPNLLKYVNVTLLSSVYIALLVKNEPLVRRADRFWAVLSATHIERISHNKSINEFLPKSMRHSNHSERVSSPRSKESPRLAEPSTKGSLSSARSSVSSTSGRSGKRVTSTQSSGRLSFQKQQIVDDEALSPRSRVFLKKSKRFLYYAINTLDLQPDAAMGDGRFELDKNNGCIYNPTKSVKHDGSVTNPRKLLSNAGTMTILGRSRNNNTLMQFFCLEKRTWHIPEDPCEMFIALDYTLPIKAACTVCGPLFFLLGGVLANGKVLHSVLAYDFQTSTFSKRNDMKYSRYNGGAVVLDGYIYVIGGLSEKKLVTNVERNLLFIDKWEDMAPIPIGGEEIISAVVEKSIYCIALRRKDSQQACCCYYMSKCDQWTMVNFLAQHLVQDSKILLASFNGLLYAGLCQNLGTMSIYYYNEQMKEWGLVRCSGSPPKREVVALLSNKKGLWGVDITGILYLCNLRKGNWESCNPSLPVVTTPLYAGIVSAVY